MINKLESPIMLSVAPKSMTYLEEDGIRHVLGLHDSASAVMGVEANFNNLAYSSVESTTDCFEILLVDTT